MAERKLSLNIEMIEYDAIDQLEAQDAELLTAARNATNHSYAPYSKFNVGAAALLSDGRIVTGTNQENAAFPAGTCAERVLMAAVISQYAPAVIQKMAVSYQSENNPSDHPISPCGVCRQVLSEYESRFGNFPIFLAGLKGKVLKVNKATDLLPLAFHSKELI